MEKLCIGLLLSFFALAVIHNAKLLNRSAKVFPLNTAPLACKFSRFIMEASPCVIFSLAIGLSLVVQREETLGIATFEPQRMNDNNMILH